MSTTAAPEAKSASSPNTKGYVRPDVLVTTEKDWAKLAELVLAPTAGDGPPLWRADVEIRFRGDDERRLLDQVTAALTPRRG